MAIEIKKAIRSFDSGQIAPIYYLKGNDQYLQSLFIEKVSSTLFVNCPIDKTFLLPIEMSGKEIVDRLLSTDLFGSRKLFILRDPQQVRGKYGEDLLAYCQSPNQNHILIVIINNFLDTSVFSKSIEKSIEPVSVQTPLERNLKSWALYFFNERKKSVHPRVVDMLIEMTGDSLHHMQNEIEKLCTWSGERSTIKDGDLDQFSGWHRNSQRWEFILALASGNLDKSVSIGKTIINENETMISLIYPLTALYQEMLYTKMNSGTFSLYKGYIPISQSIRRRIPEFAKKFSREKLEFALKQLKRIEKQQKTIFCDDESDLIQFIFNVLG